MSLELKQIRKAYDEFVAVDDMSLVVPEGVIYGVIGPNGAGKTTTIRMIMDIIAPDSGEVTWNGKPMGPELLNNIGYLPEERGLYKKMKVREIINYLAELKGCPAKVAGERMDPWLERMDLLDYRDRKVEELSKGMAQKLQFITTLIHDPDLIILDELFSGLDPVNIELIKGIVLDLKRAGKTILFSTHVMEQAEKLCDHICMISKGKKVIDGKLSDVKSQFGKNAVQVEIDGDGAFIANIPGVANLTEFNNYLEITLADGADTRTILRSLTEKVSISRFELMEPSLYQIFIDMAKVDPSKAQTQEGGDHV